jgi:hypothetical protein
VDGGLDGAEVHPVSCRYVAAVVVVLVQLE